MKLGDVHTDIRNLLKRGTTYDTDIPAFVRKAARFLERNYSFSYMESFRETALAAGDRYLAIPALVKKIGFVRMRNAGGELSYLNRVNARSQTAWSDDAIPQGYWRDGVSGLVLDSKYASGPINFELLFLKYTDWPTDLNSTHWLIDSAEDVLSAQALMFAAYAMRDNAMMAAYKLMRDEGLKTLIDSEIEATYENTDSAMTYSPDDDNYWRPEE